MANLPQMLAYLIQINEWMSRYHLTVNPAVTVRFSCLFLTLLSGAPSENSIHTIYDFLRKP